MARPAFFVLGLSHHTATLAAREQASLDDRQARAVLRRLSADERVEHAMVVSTCNRTEIYATSSVAGAEDGLREALERASGVGSATLACSGYVLREREAIAHLFRVAAGLDSALLGETEIVGQLRRAAERSEQEGMLGDLLGEAHRRALLAGRRVRRETAISRGSTSLASLVARQALEVQRDGAIVLVGAGRLVAAVAGALAGAGAPRLVIVNRTIAAARRLAALHGAQALTLEELPTCLAEADVIVSATGAPHAVLTAAQLRQCRDYRPLAIFDLAVPRDVEPAAAALPGVQLHDIDELQSLADEARRARMADVEPAMAILRGEVDRFQQWLRDLAVSPVIEELWRRAEQLRREELAHRCGDLPESERAHIDAMTASLVRKLLEGPVRRLRVAAENGSTAHAELMRELFALDDPPPPVLHVLDGYAGAA